VPALLSSLTFLNPSATPSPRFRSAVVSPLQLYTSCYLQEQEPEMHEKLCSDVFALVVILDGFLKATRVPRASKIRDWAFRLAWDETRCV
jgi:hypothetical protein